MRKPRPDAKLFNLPEEQQAQLADWLLNNTPYHKAKELVLKEFGVSVSLSAFQYFWQEVCAPALLARRRRAVSVASEVAEEAASVPGRFDAATLDAIKQKAFELAISPLSEPKEVKALFMLLQKARDQDLKSQQLTLDRERFEFDAAKACLEKLPELKAIASDSSLDSQAKMTRMRQTLFGMLPPA